MFAISNLAEANRELAYTSDKADTLPGGTNQLGGRTQPRNPCPSIWTRQRANHTFRMNRPSDNISPRKKLICGMPTSRNGMTITVTSGLEPVPTIWIRSLPPRNRLVLKNNPDFPDLANRWAMFSEPKFAETALDGPAQVKAGEEAVFDATITFKDEPYPQSDIQGVKYILYDATGAVVSYRRRHGSRRWPLSGHTGCRCNLEAAVRCIETGSCGRADTCGNSLLYIARLCSRPIVNKFSFMSVPQACPE